MGKAFELVGLAEQVKQLEKMMSTDPDFKKLLTSIIRKVLREARSELSRNAASGLQMDSDPRHAYKAVRSLVYKRILGGNLNILQKRKAGRPGNYAKPRKGLPRRGGNRWGRSQRTVSLESYEGSDRGFVLRFLNAGTADRAIRSFTSGTTGEKHGLLTGGVRSIKTRAKGGNRGSIKGRNWFGGASQKYLEKAANNMQSYIDQIINEEIIWQR